MNSMKGKLVYTNKAYYQDRMGWFKVLEHDGGQYATCKRVMSNAGVPIKNSLKRIRFDVIDLNVITPEKLEARRQAAYQAADDELKFLLDVMHK